MSASSWMHKFQTHEKISISSFVMHASFQGRKERKTERQKERTTERKKDRKKKHIFVMHASFQGKTERKNE